MVRAFVPLLCGAGLCFGASASGRMLELAGLLMIFVIAILQRQIRDSLRKGAA